VLFQLRWISEATNSFLKTSALSPAVELGAMWPPMGIEALDPFENNSIDYFLCLSSCVYISPNANNLNPFWITGFSDAESSFIISIRKKKDTKLGWSVTPIFSISLNKKDLQILEKIQYFFGVGTITFNKKDDCYFFSVQSIKHIVNAIIPHFEKNPLLTKKRIDFLLFKSAAELINAGEHLNSSGLQKIVNIRASLNKGLTDVLEKSFPDTKPVPRPAYKHMDIPNPNWFCGFVNGDGSFYVPISKSKSAVTGYNVRLGFSIWQHSRDVDLLTSFVNYMKAGFIVKNSSKPASCYVVTGFNDTVKIIIPFFEKYPLYGSKQLDFILFLEIASLMKAKFHLTNEGLNKIKDIRSKMNLRRSDIS